MLIVLIISTSCMQPKYAPPQSAEQTSNTSPTVLEKIGDCSLRWSKSGYCMNWFWEIKPTNQTAGVLVFKMYRLNQYDQTPVEVELTQMPEVILWMTDMGHGSTPTTIQRLDVGTYKVSNVFFVMPGKWEIRFQIKSADALVDGVTVALTI